MLYIYTDEVSETDIEMSEKQEEDFREELRGQGIA